jgi:hypothetical protein
MSIVLCSHLVEQPSQRAREYARHLAATAGRVGLIEADSNEVALSCFEPGSGESAPPISLDNLDERRISETLAELSFDVDHWLISLPNPRLPEARELLRAAGHWVLLTLADHDGIVATYRALKGLSELGTPRISLAVLDARDDTAAAAVFRRLEAVSEQFLHRRMEAQAPVRPAADVTEHLLLHCRSGRSSRISWQAGITRNPNIPAHRERACNATRPTRKPRPRSRPRSHTMRRQRRRGWRSRR